MGTKCRSPHAKVLKMTCLAYPVKPTSFEEVFTGYTCMPYGHLSLVGMIVLIKIAKNERVFTFLSRFRPTHFHTSRPHNKCVRVAFGPAFEARTRVIFFTFKVRTF